MPSTLAVTDQLRVATAEMFTHPYKWQKQELRQIRWSRIIRPRINTDTRYNWFQSVVWISTEAIYHFWLSRNILYVMHCMWRYWQLAIFIFGFTALIFFFLQNNEPKHPGKLKYTWHFLRNKTWEKRVGATFSNEQNDIQNTHDRMLYWSVLRVTGLVRFPQCFQCFRSESRQSSSLYCSVQ